MKVGIDYQTTGGYGGNARYTRDLTEHLVNLGEEVYLYSFLHDIRKRKTLPSGSTVHHRFVYFSPPYAPRNVRACNDHITRLASRFDGLDVFHFTNPQNVVTGAYRLVVTIHDLSTFAHESFAKTDSHTVLEGKLPIILKESSAIIAVSKYTKQDLITRFGVDANKITVVYEAADSCFYPDPDSQVTTRLGIGRFVLYAGQLQPRKNIETLIAAFAVVQKHTPDLSLVLVGRFRDEEYRQKIQNTIAQYHLHDTVVFLGGVDDTLLRKLYSTAECFVFPPLFEGFGLQPLEAMQCGTPVISSNATSLPEVVGNAGILIDPTQPEMLAEALQLVLSDRSLCDRMRSVGFQHAQEFSWDKTARETLAVYKKCS